MKGNSDITAKAFSDAALICVYLTMMLSKAAEIAHRRPLPTFDQQIPTNHALRIMNYALQRKRHATKGRVTLFLCYAIMLCDFDMQAA